MCRRNYFLQEGRNLSLEKMDSERPTADHSVIAIISNFFVHISGLQREERRCFESLWTSSYMSEAVVFGMGNELRFTDALSFLELSPVCVWAHEMQVWVHKIINTTMVRKRRWFMVWITLDCSVWENLNHLLPYTHAAITSLACACPTVVSSLGRSAALTMGLSLFIVPLAGFTTIHSLVVPPR